MSGRVVNVRPKPGYAFDAARASIIATDSLSSAIGRFSRPYFGNHDLSGHFGRELALAAYHLSGMLKKVIAIPADDRVREWRDWQAEADVITKIEGEEKRLGLQAKVKYAEVMRGVGGGALILVTKGSGPNYHSTELRPEALRAGDLVAVNLVSRRQLECKEFIRDVANPRYGEPEYFEIATEGGNRVRLHPSRVVCFRGEPYPDSLTVSDLDAFWGDCRLTRVYREATRADDTQGWFASLVKKAKLLRVGIPDLLDMSATAEGRATLDARIALIAEGENSLNATVYRSGTGTDDPGEKIDDYQITWAGIPAVMDAFDQRVAAVADIPFTRLMGRSPAGMNATGEHDTQNWNRMIASGQNLEVCPCLDQIDRALLPSAGVKPDAVTWKFAPLELPNEKTEAETFKLTAEALDILDRLGIMPSEALNEVGQNLLTERQWLPGIDTVLAKIPESERFGGASEDDGTDPSAITQREGGDLSTAARVPVERAANDSFARMFTDATPRPLYVRRDLKPASAKALIAWAKSNGFTTTLEASDMHVTVLYSKQPVDPMKMGETWGNEDDGGLTVKAGGPRALERFGEGAVVLQFASWNLASRHDDMVRAGASHDYPEYSPHVTITYSAPAGLDLEAVRPFTGELAFGPEIFEPLDADWKGKINEA